MPIYRWPKESAWLITKAARYAWPALIAAGGAVIGFFTGRASKKKKPKDKPEAKTKDP